MGFLASIIAFALCAFVYVRMIRREVPEQIGKAQAWVPIAVGIAAPSRVFYLPHNVFPLQSPF